MAFYIGFYAYAIIGNTQADHQTLLTCSYMQDKYFRQKRKGKGPILLELFPFVVLNGSLYRVLCLCYYRQYTGLSTPTTAFEGAI